MKRKLGIFLSSLLFGAIGIGFLYSSLKEKNVKPVDAALNLTKYITLDENGTCRFGSYPQNIVTDISANTIRNQGSLKETSIKNKYYIYNSKKYAIIENAVIDTEGSNDRYFSNGEAVNDYIGRSDVVIEFNDIEWELLKIPQSDPNVAYLISSRILDREIFNEPVISEAPDYIDSDLYKYINYDFKEMAFSQNDEPYFTTGKGDIKDVRIDIPTQDDVALDLFEDKNLKPASDFSILKNLSSHSAWNHGTGVPYLNAPYWLDTHTYEIERMKACWAKVAISNCLVDDPKIGVRPVIAVHYASGSGGGSSGGDTSTSTSTTKKSGGNVALGLGIGFTIVGLGGLSVFFVLWSKKGKAGRPATWIIVSLSCCLVISIVGLSCLGGGLKGGGSGGIKYGYYTQQFANTSSGGIARIGGSGWLIKSDGTCIYCGFMEDMENASDFREESKGTWTYKNGKLICKTTSPLGDSTNTYTYKGDGKLYYGSTLAYKWVRGE